MGAAHAQHILLPLSPEEEYAGLCGEYDRQKQVWKRKPKRLEGRALVVKNLPFRTEKGEEKTWNPLQVACAALDRAIANGIDVIRVETPGETLLVKSMDFSVQDLKNTMRKDGMFYPDVMNGKVSLEDEARNVMPYRWELTESGMWFPTH